MPTKSPGGQNGGPEKRGVFGAFLGVPRGGQKTGFFRVFSGFFGFFGQKPGFWGFWPILAKNRVFDRFLTILGPLGDPSRSGFGPDMVPDMVQTSRNHDVPYDG